MFSASLTISIASKALMVRACRLAHLSVCLSVCLFVCPESVLWQNGPFDPDVVWDGEWGRSRMDVLDGVVIVEAEGAVFGVNLGRPIVTNGTFVA